MSVRRRGIFLISSLITLVLVAMIITASLSLTSGFSLRADSSSDHANAKRAAESGLRYAEVRLQEDPGWRGDGNGIILNTPDLFVVEDRGNVYGLVKVAGQDFSQFRIRFNFQDGSAGGDGLDDPQKPTNFAYVSVNNLAKGTPTPLPRVDSNGIASHTPGSEEAPPFTAVVIVEGRAGNGLRQASPSNLLPADVEGQVSTSVMEAYLRVTGVNGLNAASMSAKDFVVDLGASGDTMTLAVQDKESQSAVIRSKESIKVLNGKTSGNLKAENGEARTKTGNIDARFESGDLTLATEQSTDRFYQLSFDEVEQADPSGNSLAAGTYVWWETSSGGELHYYDMNYEAYVKHIEANPTDPGSTSVSLPSSVSLSGTQLSLTGDVYIKKTGKGTTDFTLIPRGGAPEDPPSAVSTGFSSQAYAKALIAAGITLPQNRHGWRSTPTLSEFFAAGGPGDDPNWTTVIPGFQFRLAGDNNQGFEYQIDSQVVPTPTLEQAIEAFIEQKNPSGSYWQQNTTSGNGWEGQAKVWGVQVESVSPDALKELELGGTVSDNLTVNETQIHFSPPEGKSATLTSQGDIRIGGGVFGQGGSITSQGQIRISGLGTDLSANPNGQEGVSLYAKGDIVLSALKPTGTSGSYTYGDFNLKGVVYTQSNFEAKLGYDDPSVGDWGNLALTGSLVAYGGDPAGEPGANGNGSIKVTAKKFDLTFDPAYMNMLDGSPAGVRLEQTLKYTHR